MRNVGLGGRRGVTPSPTASTLHWTALHSTALDCTSLRIGTCYYAANVIVFDELTLIGYLGLER